MPLPDPEAFPLSLHQSFEGSGTEQTGACLRFLRPITIKHLLAGTALDIVGKPDDLAIAVVVSMGQDGMLGRGELGVHGDLRYLVDDDDMNASFPESIKQYLESDPRCSTFRNP